MLRADALKDARLGVLKPLFGDAPEDQEVARIVQSAVNAMKAQGAVPVDVAFSELTGMLANTSVIDLEFREDEPRYSCSRVFPNR